jgi:Concanavalin A-like lectin/glucanases superfamily/Immunoglobulin domain/Immunoglobulin I-set domain
MSTIQTPHHPFVLPNIGSKVLAHIGLLILALCLASPALAQTVPQIGLKFGINGLAGLQNTNAGALQPGDLAGPTDYAQTNWNVLGLRGDNVLGISNPTFNVLDSSGANSGITVNWEANNLWSVANGGNPIDLFDPNSNLMNGYLDSNGSGNVAMTNGLPLGVVGQSVNNRPLIYISGLQAWLSAHSVPQYDVVVYMDGDVATGRTGEYWIQAASGAVSNITFTTTDITTHIFMRDHQNFTANTIYQRVPFTSNTGRTAGSGNYAVFTGLSTDSFVIRTAEFNTRCGINAVQIVPRAIAIGPTIDPLLPCSTYAGWRAVFRANAAGVVPMTFQWQKNGSPLSDGGNISGSSTANLVITGVGVSDAASYSVVVSNAGGITTSTSASLGIQTLVGGSYAEKIFTNNPIAYWRFNENNDPSTNFSVAYDPVGGFNARYGTLALNGFNGVAGPQSPDFPGFENGNSALQSAGSTVTPIPYPSSYITWAVAPPLNLNTNTVTMCAWIKPNAVAQLASTALIFARGGGSDVCGFGYLNNTLNHLAYTWNNQNFAVDSGLVPASNVWSFVALAVSPTNAILYLYNTNGQFSFTNTLAHTNAAFGGLTMIGDDPSSTGIPQNRAFSGAIDEAAVFNRTLSDQELYLIFKKGLNVGIIPAGISVQPTSEALFTGRTARFTVAASGDKPLTYQWRTNGVNLVNNNHATGVNTATLTINNVALSDAANYDVVVDNIAHIPVSSAPATLTVIASNSSPVAYEGALQAANPNFYWRFDETNGSPYAFDYWGGNIATNINLGLQANGPQPPDFPGFSNTNVANSFDGIGAYTDTQISPMNNLAAFSIIGWFNTPAIEPLRTGLFGQNDCAEFGFHGADASGAAQLGIWTPNGNAAFLSQTNIVAGQWYFAAGVGNGSSINLYLFGTNGAGGAQVLQSTVIAATTNYGASAYPFRIGGGGILDDPATAGNYFSGNIDEVAIFNRALSVGELSTLYASAIGVGALPPQITVQPAPATNILYSGRTARMSVTVVGSSPLSYQWRTNGVPLSNGGNVSGATSANLVISNLTAANIGLYDVVIGNSAGSVTSSIVSLGVITPVVGGYEATAIGMNPLAYYRLNETNGTIAYDFYGGNAGTYGIGAVQAVPGPQGPAFFGFETNNTGVGVSVSANSSVAAPFGSLSTNTVTMAMWVNPNGTFDQFAGLLMNRGAGVLGGFGYTGNQIGYTWNNNNANTYNFRSGFIPPLNQWSFVGVVVTPTNATIYYGNPPNALQTAVNAIAHTSDVFGNNWKIGTDDINNNNDGVRNFVGSVDEVAVFTRSLSFAEMQTLYSVGVNGQPVSIRIQRSGDNVTLTWARGTLLEADQITGPWSTNNAASPYTLPPAGAGKFYRVQVK